MCRSVVERDALKAWGGRCQEIRKKWRIKGLAVLVRSGNKCSESKDINLKS